VFIEGKKKKKKRKYKKEVQLFKSKKKYTWHGRQ
jgi:hypothetical protein